MTTCVGPQWAAAIESWLYWCALVPKHSFDTRKTRREHLQRLARTIGVPDPWAVDAATLAGWFERQDWKTETRRGHKSTLVGFYGWAAREGHVATSPTGLLPIVKPSVPNPQPCPDSVYLPALSVADERETLMMRLAAQHGMRRGEIVLVHTGRDLIEDLLGWSLVVHGKGGKERIIPLLDDVAAQLRALPRGWAFPGEVNGHLSARWAGKLINRLLAGDWTIHKLRHRAATEWWEASDHDLFVVQELLGHASPATTRMYVLIARQRLRHTVMRAAGRPSAADVDAAPAAA